MYQRTPYSQVFRIAIIASSIVCLLAFPISAQVTLYDNLDNLRGDDGDWFTANGPDRKFAQQFLLGDRTNIDQVTIPLQRPQPAATGSLRFELWRDNGAGHPVPADDPTGKIANLGTVVDVTKIPVGRFADYTFDNLILGLEPNQPFWIVTDYSDVRGIGGGKRSVGVAQVYDDPAFRPTPPDYDATAGTNGAGHLHAYRDGDPTWGNLKEFFGAKHLFQAMKVEAMGLLDAVDIDVVSSAIRQNLTDERYDLNEDGSVNAEDRTHWVHDLANTFFGDSNLDGEFNSSDLTVVFAANEYEDNITLNSTWAEGDWNGDGDFDSGDLIVAFKDGGYEQGPRVATVAVPEPSSVIPLAIGALGFIRRRRSCNLA